MADRLLSETEFSLARFINTYVSGCFVVSPEFNWDFTQAKTVRNLPFYAVKFFEEIEDAGFVDGGDTNNPQMSFIITACGRTQRESREMIGNLKQAMRTCRFTASGVYYSEQYNGIPLYESSINRSILSQVGVLNYDFGFVDDAFHDDKTTYGNLKFSSKIEITLSPIYRTNSVDLL